MIYELNDILSYVDMSESQTSSVVNIKRLSGYCLHHYWTEGTTDRQGQVVVSGSTYPDRTFTPIDTYNVDANSDSRLVVYEHVHYGYLKVDYECIAPGGGTLTVTISGKQ